MRQSQKLRSHFIFSELYYCESFHAIRIPPPGNLFMFIPRNIRCFRQNELEFIRSWQDSNIQNVVQLIGRWSNLISVKFLML